MFFFRKPYTGIGTVEEEKVWSGDNTAFPLPLSCTYKVVIPASLDEAPAGGDKVGYKFTHCNTSCLALFYFPQREYRARYIIHLSMGCLNVSIITRE
jgi:hypothetical protein